MNEFSLDSDKIKEEIAKSGKVARTKVQEATEAFKDATTDARVTAAIKAKLIADPELSAWSISVNTTEGVVTLSGTAPSHEAIGRALLLALEMDGVREAVSTLQIRQVK